MTRRPQLPILALLAVALFLRALVPAGWMPAPRGGPFAIQPCPAASPEPMAAMAGDHGAMSGYDGSSHHEHQGGDACFSALLIGFAPVDQPALQPAPTPAAATHASYSAAPDFKTGPPAPPPPSTGPPSIA